jgi:cell wall-associated NlpC family hydrolase
LNTRDARLHAYRPDLADARLKGEIASTRFVDGNKARIVVPVADLRAAPRPDSGVNSQLLFGEEVLVFEDADGWAWVQSQTDGYVGYVSDNTISTHNADATHVVTAPRTFIYPGPDLKKPRTAELSMGSLVSVSDFVEARGTTYAVLASGEALIAKHLIPFGKAIDDYVSVAETLLYTPYLWGGASAFGIDCSGLVQLSMRMAGRHVLRDSDMQAASIGEVLDPGAGLKRGDLVFWKGHVAIMTDPKNMIHANGHTMDVSREGLAEAIERIGYLYGQPTGFRRP